MGPRVIQPIDIRDSDGMSNHVRACSVDSSTHRWMFASHADSRP